jgi:NADPH:quinone reductase-like Zn-dependent oxidoreductase
LEVDKKGAAVGKPCKTMRAWTIDGDGDPERMQLRELPVPLPGPRDVLIRMCSAEIADRNGIPHDAGWVDRTLPPILGVAGAGRIAATGSEVTGLAEGDAVYACGRGAWAEYMCVPAAHVAPVPASLDLACAGALPVAALIALQTLEEILDVRRRDVVLVTAASGGVGHIAVQVAKRLGASLVAMTSATDRRFVEGLGADMVIDESSRDFVAAIHSRYPDGVDKVLNSIPGATANAAGRALRQGGHMVDLTGTATFAAPRMRIEVEHIVQPDPDRLSRFARLVDDGRIVVEVAQLMRFEQAPEALTRARGTHVRGTIGLQCLVPQLEP